MHWTPEQFLKLAPDAASAKATHGFLAPKKWAPLGVAETAIPVHAQGSGSNPYQSQVDLAEPAFKCSCPSRKFPCKHGLALFLLFAVQPALCTKTAPPDTVASWQKGRGDRAAKKDTAATRKSKDPKHTEAQAKTAARRLDRVKDGALELQRSLEHRSKGIRRQPPSKHSALGVAGRPSLAASIAPAANGIPSRTRLGQNLSCQPKTLQPAIQHGYYESPLWINAPAQRIARRDPRHRPKRTNRRFRCLFRRLWRAPCFYSALAHGNGCVRYRPSWTDTILILTSDLYEDWKSRRDFAACRSILHKRRSNDRDASS